jgi:2-amino-4-hydroxy-6-hydroxymethyldihydropteridine diphosphokinase
MFDDAVLIALGSSLAGRFGSREALLEAALEDFPAAGLELVKRSAWWRSASWPDPGMPDYLNGLALVETALSPHQTLAALRRIEAVFGRRRDASNGPRTLDLDLIAHGRLVLDEPGPKSPRNGAIRCWARRRRTWRARRPSARTQGRFRVYL